MNALATLSLLLVFAWPAAAQGDSAGALHHYPGADLALGARLIQQHRCEACHARKMGGDGAAVYRPAGRVNNPAALLTMVERCNTELNLAMFPEEVMSVAGVLQRDHYRFAARRPAP